MQDFLVDNIRTVPEPEILISVIPASIPARAVGGLETVAPLFFVWVLMISFPGHKRHCGRSNVRRREMRHRRGSDL